MLPGVPVGDVAPADHAQRELLPVLSRLTQQPDHPTEVVLPLLRLQHVPGNVLDDPRHAFVGEQIEPFALRSRDSLARFRMVVGVVHKEHAERRGRNRHRRAAAYGDRRLPSYAPAAGNGEGAAEQDYDPWNQERPHRLVSRSEVCRGHPPEPDSRTPVPIGL